LPIGAPVFHSLIVHSENGVPVQIEDRFVNPSAAPDYLEQDFTLTPNAYLTATAPLSGSEHVVEAAMPQAWECKLLTILKSEPCLLIRRRTWSETRRLDRAPGLPRQPLSLGSTQRNDFRRLTPKHVVYGS
jgi:GntR family histidine utilization transcriptional repressor